jgi:hypothetical protein
MRRLHQVARFLGAGLSGVFGLVPALIAGAGVFLVVAGLLNYLAPVAANPSATPTFEIKPTGSVSLPSPSPQGSSSPGPSSTTSATTAPGGALATRIQVPALGIDLPIVAPPPNETFPLCNAAEYWVDHSVTPARPLATPGAAQATYIYAHARTGMFLPLLSHSMVNDGKDMIGMYVVVYTDDNERHIYEIDQVIRHVSTSSASLDRASAATTDQLWLQTSEGPNKDSTKLQVVATPLGVLAADPADAHPAGKGRVCA